MWEVDEFADNSSSSPKVNTKNWIAEEVKNEKPSTSQRIKNNTNLVNKKLITPRKNEKRTNTESNEVQLNDANTSTPKSSLKFNKKTSASLVKNPFSTPVSSTKKVKIALNLNRSQDHREYHKSLVSSPGIPYDADRKPSKPLLKSRSSMPNAVNPFYKLL